MLYYFAIIASYLHSIFLEKHDTNGLVEVPLSNSREGKISCSVYFVAKTKPSCLADNVKVTC